jgi:predicted MFS family arabinose efflux permease
MENKSTNRGRAQVYRQLLLLALSAGAIFRLVYIRVNFQEPLMKALRLDLVELNGLYTWLGLAIVAGYVPSGWLADRISSKKLMIAALLMSAALSAGLSWLPGYAVARWYFVGLGISSVWLFWAAHMRCAKLLASAEHEGRMFGFLDGARGAGEALFGTIAYIGYNTVVDVGLTQRQGMQGVFWYFSFTQIVFALLVAAFVQERITPAEPVEEDRLGAMIPKLSMLAKQRVVWVSMAIFSGYTLFFAGLSMHSLFVVNFAQDSHQVMAWISYALWMRVLGAWLGGVWADKKSKPFVLMASMLVSMAVIVVLLLLPSSPGWVLVILLFVLSLSTAMIRGVYWSLISYIQVDKRYLGRVIGLVSFVGYLPDLLLPLLSVYLFRLLPEMRATPVYLWCTLYIGMMGFFSLVNLYRTPKPAGLEV